MYIYGGQINSCENTNQFISYDFEKNEWALVRPKMEGDLLPIDSHTANIWEKEENKKTMIVFGGFIGGTIGDYSNAVYEYDFEQNEWKTLFENKPVDAIEITKTTVPQGRMSHAAAISNNCLYIFGGFDGNTRLNDTWSFDLVEKKWQRLGLEGFVPEVRLQLCSLIFQPRNGHSLIAYKNNIILFGGIHDVTHEKNDILVFDISKNTWSVLEKETKWAFEEDYKSDKSNKSYLKAETGVNQFKPSKFGAEKKDMRLITLDQDSISVSMYTQQESPRNNESKYTIQKNFQIPKTHKYHKLKLESYTFTHKGLVSPQSTKNFSYSPTGSEFKSSLQERKEKDALMKKNALLKEFEVSDKEGESLRAATPTTEAMRKSISGLGFTVDNQSDFQMQKMALDQTKIALLKNYEVNNASIKLGVKPCARDGHSACVDGNKLYIFAGDRHKMSFNDLFVLHLEYIQP